MEEVSDIISLLEKDVRKLLKSHADLKGRNGKLASELDSLRKELEVQKETIKNLEERNKILKLAKSFADSTSDKEEMKQKINELVREINKCIALMNN